LLFFSMLRHLKAKQLQRSFHASRLLNIGEGENIFHTYKGQLGRLPVRLDESDEIFAGTTVDSRATVSTSERGPGRLVVLNNPRNLNRVDFGIAKTLLQQFKVKYFFDRKFLLRSRLTTSIHGFRLLHFILLVRIRFQQVTTFKQLFDTFSKMIGLQSRVLSRTSTNLRFTWQRVINPFAPL
jgi:hypothetical protein